MAKDNKRKTPHDGDSPLGAKRIRLMESTFPSERSSSNSSSQSSTARPVQPTLSSLTQSSVPTNAASASTSSAPVKRITRSSAKSSATAPPRSSAVSKGKLSNSKVLKARVVKSTKAKKPVPPRTGPSTNTRSQGILHNTVSQIVSIRPRFILSNYLPKGTARYRIDNAPADVLRDALNTYASQHGFFPSLYSYFDDLGSGRAVTLQDIKDNVAGDRRRDEYVEAQRRQGAAKQEIATSDDTQGDDSTDLDVLESQKEDFEEEEVEKSIPSQAPIGPDEIENKEESPQAYVLPDEVENKEYQSGNQEQASTTAPSPAIEKTTTPERQLEERPVSSAPISSPQIPQAIVTEQAIVHKESAPISAPIPPVGGDVTHENTVIESTPARISTPPAQATAAEEESTLNNSTPLRAPTPTTPISYNPYDVYHQAPTQHPSYNEVWARFYWALPEPARKAIFDDIDDYFANGYKLSLQEFINYSLETMLEIRMPEKWGVETISDEWYDMIDQRFNYKDFAMAPWYFVDMLRAIIEGLAVQEWEERLGWLGLRAIKWCVGPPLLNLAPNMARCCEINRQLRSHLESLAREVRERATVVFSPDVHGTREQWENPPTALARISIQTTRAEVIRVFGPAYDPDVSGTIMNWVAADMPDSKDLGLNFTQYNSGVHGTFAEWDAIGRPTVDDSLRRLSYFRISCGRYDPQVVSIP